jgi:hypothetical protein
MHAEVYLHGIQWAHTLALLSERVPAAELLEELATAEAITDPALLPGVAARQRVIRDYLEATAIWKESASRFLREWERTEPAAARARDALRKEAQQEQTAAGPPVAGSERS